MRLSGTYHPIPYILERILLYIPNVKEVAGLWMDYDKRLYYSVENRPLTEELKVKAQQHRNTDYFSTWSDNFNLFAHSKNPKSQLSLSDEDQLHVLKLYFRSPIDGLKDIVAINFSPESFLKSLNIEFKGISSKEKNMLSSFLNAVLQVEYDNIFQERANLLKLEQLIDNKNKKIETLNDQLHATERLYTQALESLIREQIDTLSRQLNKEFELTNAVIYKIAKERYTHKEIKQIINDAVYLAYNFNLTKNSIVIHEDFVLPIEKRQQVSTPSVSAPTNDKVLSLLNRYETAAKKLEEQGLVLNAKNIASRMSPSITPPAITDAVKKNKNKIAYYLAQYPDRWALIRTAIRPIAQLDADSANKRAI